MSLLLEVKLTSGVAWLVWRTGCRASKMFVQMEHWHEVQHPTSHDLASKLLIVCIHVCVQIALRLKSSSPIVQSVQFFAILVNRKREIHPFFLSSNRISWKKRALAAVLHTQLHNVRTCTVYFTWFSSGSWTALIAEFIFISVTLRKVRTDQTLKFKLVGDM